MSVLKNLLPVLTIVTAIRLADGQTPTPTPNEITALEPNGIYTRDINGGERHNYQISLPKGHFFGVEVNARGLDLGLALILPSGERRAIYDPIGLKQEQMTVERVAEEPGLYIVQMYMRSRATGGKYDLRLAALRVATEKDLALHESRKLIAAFWRLTRDGRHLQARKPLEDAIAIRKRYYGPENIAMNELYQMLSNNYRETDEYASAEPLELRSVRVVESTFGPDHQQTADAYRQLGTFYNSKGDHLKAIETFQKALVLFERARQPESIQTASLYSYLGDSHYEQGDYGRADEYFGRSLEIRQKILGPDSFHLIDSLENLARVAYDREDFQKALGAIKRALDISEKTVGKESPRLVWLFNHLGDIYTTTGDYPAADSAYQRAIAIQSKTTGLIGANAHTTFIGLARLRTIEGKIDEAITLQQQASVVEERYVGLNLFAGSEREKMALLKPVAGLSSRYLTMHTRFAPENAAAREAALLTILRRKGRVQDALSAGVAALRRRSSPEDQKALDDLAAISAKLSKLVLNGPDKAGAEEFQQQVKTIEVEKEKLEVEVSSRSVGAYPRPLPVTIEAVRAALPDDAALVEFAIYRPFDPAKPENDKAFAEPRYVVYVLRRTGEIGWKELGPASTIDRAIGAWRAALRDPKRTDERTLARAVEERVMQPIRTILSDSAHLLISPDGELNLIPFAALPAQNGRHLVDNYAISYLTSGRDLLRMQSKQTSQTGPLIVANPMFGLQLETGARRRRLPRKSVTATRSLNETYFTPLGGTVQEARLIRTAFPDAQTLTGTEATESTLKQTVAPRLLHIATHGFFLQNSEMSSRIGNPLLRAGLALSGANGRNGAADDGILTALEASGLNLWGTKLVVLSACDTGLGDIKNGEGVYGLRRAFTLAGTESLVMSLWAVSDYSTRELMSRYYANLKYGQGRGAALRNAQLEMLKRKDRAHPFYWAAFIQAGEWANLDGKR